MMTKGIDVSQFIEAFIQTARERLLKLEQAFLKLEKKETKELVQEAFREAHTLKGEAKMLGLKEISEVAHSLENLLGEIRDKKRKGSETVDELLKKLEEIKGFINQIDKKEIKKETKISQQETIRIKTGLLEKMGNLALETVLNLRQIEKNNFYLRQLLKKQIELKKEWENLSDFFPSEEIQTFQEKLFSFFENLKKVWFRYENTLSYQSPITEELFYQSISSRMVPLSTIFNLYSRQIRDMAKELGKLVDFTVSGGEIEVDRAIVEALNEPLIHLLRNALDHGIELPLERQKKGKPEIGKISLKATQHKGKITIEVEDDGRGVDLNKIKEIALKQGIIWKEREIKKEIPLEIIEIMAFSGFTTCDKVTKFSGRGVGLDVVKKVVEHLNGSWRIFSEPDKGTKVILELPISIALLPSLLIKANGQLFAIPTKWIEEIREIKIEEITKLQNRELIKLNKDSILLLDLNQVIGFSRLSPRPRIPVVILRYQEYRCAFKIENLVDNQDIIIKPLNKYLKTSLALGSSILEDGTVAIILNVFELVKASGDTKYYFKETFKPFKKKTLKVLVVDDALITRTMLKNILVSAGYEVTTAVNGMDALKYLAETPFDVVVTDIEMPKMDGFQLTSEIKRHPNLKDIPVIIITSHETEEEKRKGLEVGADAYLLKSKFSQEFLLETIERLTS